MLALILTVVRSSPEGVMSFQLATREVRAAPGAAQVITHDLTALEVFNFTLLRNQGPLRRSHPHRPKQDVLPGPRHGCSSASPRVLVEPDPASKQVTVAVNDKREVFSTADVTSLWRLAAGLKRVFRFVQGNMNSGADLAQSSTRRQRHAGHARSAL
jgi:hypothetical protein